MMGHDDELNRLLEPLRAEIDGHQRRLVCAGVAPAVVAQALAGWGARGMADHEGPAAAAARLRELAEAIEEGAEIAPGASSDGGVATAPPGDSAPAPETPNGAAHAAAHEHPEAEPDEPELPAARVLRDELAHLVREHVNAGRISPNAAAEACKAIAAEAIAELAGGGDMGLGTAGHVLRRFGEDLAADAAARVAGGEIAEDPEGPRGRT